MLKKEKINEYRIEGSLSAQDMLKTIIKIDRKIQEPYYKSQEPTYWRNSNKLTGATFEKEILNDNEVDHAVFFYSNYCHACKMIGPEYEGLVREKLAFDHHFGADSETNIYRELKFNRINNSLNSLPGTRNFAYTPVLALYKRGTKLVPYLFKSNIFAPQLLRDFFTVTRDSRVMVKEEIETCFEEQKLNNMSLRNVKNRFETLIS